MRALRLPAHALSLPYWFGRGTHALLSHSCSPRRSRRTERSPPGLEQLVSRRSAFRLVAPVDASGISQVPWRSVPCLCPAPGPRSSRGNLAFGGLLDAAPGFRKPKASTGGNIEAHTGLQHPLSTLHERRRRRPCKTRFRLAGSPLPGGRRTLWIAAKGFRSVLHPPFQGLSCRKQILPKAVFGSSFRNSTKCGAL